LKKGVVKQNPPSSSAGYFFQQGGGLNLFQFDAHRGAVVYLRPQDKYSAAVVVVDNPLAERESQTPASGLGGEARLEYALVRGFWYTFSGVGDVDV
jgi:hypothetical protein